MIGMKEIMRALPHRFGFLMVDRVEEVVTNERVVGYKNVTSSEWWAAGHFPEEPVFPGVLMVETMTQIGALMFSTQEEKGNKRLGFLCGLDKVKFVRQVIPGDVIRVEGTFMAQLGQLRQVKCVATVNGELAASAVISYAI